MDEVYFKKVMTASVIVILVVLAFLLLRPILLSIIFGVILAFMFSPLYDLFYKKIHSKNLSALLVCAILILILFLPLWFLMPIIVEQSFKIFQASQQVDFVTPLQNIFPSLFAAEESANEIGTILHSFVINLTNSLTNSFGSLILNFPTIFLHFIVTAFTFFFMLKDKDLFVAYLRSLLPFHKNLEKEIFESSKDITYSVIYGQIIVGLMQGIIVGIGFFVLGIPNALFLTILACLAGIFPVIGTTIIWLPVALYMFVTGSEFIALGIAIFGVLSNLVDNFVRPLIVSKKARMHPALVLIGMIGGLFFFGILGFILGPLILAYLFILLDLYRNKKTPGLFITDDSSSKGLNFNFLQNF